MTEIKPVYQYKTAGMLINYWQDVDEEIFVKINKDQFYTTRIIYPAAAYEAKCNEVDQLQKENAELKEDLQFVERWANHHASHPNITAQEALSVIQHYPSIEEITKSYKDGVIPKTRNPYAEIESLRKQVESVKYFLLNCASPDCVFAANTLRDQANTLLDQISASKNGE